MRERELAHPFRMSSLFFFSVSIFLSTPAPFGHKQTQAAKNWPNTLEAALPTFNCPGKAHGWTRSTRR
ncbi:hypothetical protein Q31a_52350 [Aureliella helgolandensis]|uniref:Uncharacterized protein n=1 Tax=Aureliella helgolandensis TaxID=2527968 RepID=A0A518GE32_9BACT|nr:hypothetical protein Q31a_52350 [Aureliella helgolandensis]